MAGMEHWNKTVHCLEVLHETNKENCSFSIYMYFKTQYRSLYEQKTYIKIMNNTDKISDNLNLKNNSIK